MKNFLFISNKYISGLEVHIHYKHFLNEMKTVFDEASFNLDMVFFSENMKPFVDQEWTKYFRSSGKKLSGDQINALESKYGFTFKQALYPDILQVFPTQLGRTYYVPERYMDKALETEPEKFLFLEGLFEKKKYDLVFVDQSPESEMEFARAICLTKGIPFIRYTWAAAAFGRTVLHLQKRFGEEDIVEDIVDESANEDVSKWIDYYREHSKLPYPDVPWNKEFPKTPLLTKIKMQGKQAPAKIFGVVYRNIAKVVLKFETLLKDLFLYDRFDKNEKFLFYGFHLPTESTMGLRCLPFLNQFMLIEQISRCLPYGYTLYVREHPWWRDQYPISYVLAAKRLPNVKLMSPKIPITEVLEHTRGVLTLNATTGIEALLRGKPVLAFAENIYSDFHPAALKCDNPFLIGEMLAKLIATPVHRADTENYLKRLYNSSFVFKAESFCMVSEDDARSKARVLGNSLLKAYEKVCGSSSSYQKSDKLLSRAEHEPCLSY